MAKIGVCFVNPAPQVQPRQVIEAAKQSEELGFHSFWLIDRIAYDNLEPLTALAAAAAVTEKIRLGTSVLLAALRQPALLAKMVATLDFLSGGRVTLGIGFGSRENDFTATGVPFNQRGSRAEETIRLMKRLWREDRVSFEGKFFNVRNLTLGPRPIQSPHPPIWMGGTAETVLKRVGRLANGYICGSSAIQDFSTLWEKIASAAIEVGRDPQEIEKAALTFIAIDENKGRAIDACAAYVKRYYGQVRMDIEKHLLVGAPEECAERIESFIGKGLQTLIVGLVTPELKQLELFGRKILPRLRS
ncbi:MAG: LLM class flavin-dependent oxidoreductase [Deltaproteobacteria bacterium]|nr:LLM class flavin-dependent oxidoreductase [Deltaproteobacteria bacterium]